MNTSISRLALCTGLTAACLALSACQPKPDEPTVGQKVDKAIADADRSAEKTKAELKDMAQDARVAGNDAMNKVETGVGDAAITTSVNAQLAKDAELSALSIDVDTREGRVALKGKAPNMAARDRATQLALGVKGVIAVDNQLVVAARG